MISDATIILIIMETYYFAPVVLMIGNIYIYHSVGDTCLNVLYMFK